MKKFLTVLAMLLVLVQVGTLVFVSAAEPQSFDDYLITHWDFEGIGDAALADKATKGSSSDTLTIGGTVTLENGTAKVPSTKGNYMSAEGVTGDLSNLQNKTIVVKFKMLHEGNNNMSTPVSKKGAFMLAFYLNQNNDTESVYDPLVRAWDGKDGNDYRFTNASTSSTKNWPGPDESYHYYVMSFKYDATAGTMTHSYYYSPNEYPADKDAFIEMFTETVADRPETVMKSEEPLMLGKWAAGDSDRALSFVFDDVKIYDTALTIEQVHGTLNIDTAAASSALATTTEATTVATTAAQTTQGTTVAATTKAATTAAATTAAATAATTAAEEGGCGGVIAIPAVALVGVISATGCMIKRKKR